MSKEHVHDSVREEFKKLSLDGKTAFLVEAIFSTAGSAINEIGSRLNGLVSLVTDPFDGSDSGEDDAAGSSGESAGGDSGEGPEAAKSSSDTGSGKKAGDSGKGRSAGK